MSLADDLKRVAQEQPSAASKPAKLDEPHARTEFDGETGYIQTAGLSGVSTPDHDAILTEFGYDPATVQIVGNPRISKWQFSYRDYSEDELGVMKTEWRSAYRFNIAPRTVIRGGTDLDALIKRARAKKPVGTKGDGHWFVFQVADLQLGKRSRDGSTEQIIERVVESIEGAKEQLKFLGYRYPIAGVQISMPGDCLEGAVSQGGRNMWLTQETITEQTRILRRLMLHMIDEFRSAPKVYLDVVNGNHDQAMREPVSTYPGDGWATECAISVADAITLNPAAYGHVEVRVPDKWSGTMTVPVGDSVVTIAHGHQWGKNKSMTWWSEQALHCQPAAAAHLLQHGHLHELQVEQNATRTRIQSPTLDCGSDWWRDKHGSDSRRGCAVYLLKAGDVSHLSVV